MKAANLLYLLIIVNISGALPIVCKDGNVNVEFIEAAKNGNVAKIQKLFQDVKLAATLAIKRFLNIQDADGNTPLIWAVRGNHLETVQVLLQLGADVNIKDNEMDTALHWAAIKGGQRTDIVKALLDSGASINMQDKQGRTPLTYTIRVNSPAIANILLDHGANVYLKDKKGMTILDLAKRNRLIMNLIEAKTGTKQVTGSSAK